MFIAGYFVNYYSREACSCSCIVGKVMNFKYRNMICVFELQLYSWVV